MNNINIKGNVSQTLWRKKTFLLLTNDLYTIHGAGDDSRLAEVMKTWVVINDFYG